MKLEQYIESCLNEWPEKIEMDGANKLNNNLYFFPALIRIHDLLQEKDYDYFKGVVLYEIFKYIFEELKIKIENKDFSEYFTLSINRSFLKENILREIKKQNEKELNEKLKSLI